MIKKPYCEIKLNNPDVLEWFNKKGYKDIEGRYLYDLSVIDFSHFCLSNLLSIFDDFINDETNSLNNESHIFWSSDVSNYFDFKTYKFKEKFFYLSVLNLIENSGSLVFLKNGLLDSLNYCVEDLPLKEESQSVVKERAIRKPTKWKPFQYIENETILYIEPLPIAIEKDKSTAYLPGIIGLTDLNGSPSIFNSKSEFIGLINRALENISAKRIEFISDLGKLLSNSEKELKKAKDEIKKLEEEKQNRPKFLGMNYGPMTSKLSTVNNKVDIQVDFEGMATFQNSRKDIKVFIDEYNKLGFNLSVGCIKLLDACCLELSTMNTHREDDQKKINNKVTIPLKEYANLCGITPSKDGLYKFRKKVEKDLNTLYRVSVEWKEKAKGKQYDYSKVRLLSKVGIKKGVIEIECTSDFASYINNRYVMQFPMELFKIDERNQNAYRIARKLSEHMSIVNNSRFKTDNIISVKTLLEYCQDIPTYQTVNNEDRAFTRRIIEPFQKSLDAINGLTWEFCNSKHGKISDYQLSDFNYTIFESLYIRFEFNGIKPSFPLLSNE